MRTLPLLFLSACFIDGGKFPELKDDVGEQLTQTSANPSALWSYGYKSAPGADDFKLFDKREGASDGTTQDWKATSDDKGSIGPVGTLNNKTSLSLQNTKTSVTAVRYTAVASGDYAIDLSFLETFSMTVAGTGVTVPTGGTQNAPATVTKIVTLPSGEFIDIECNGTQGHCTLAGTITPTGAH